MRISEKVAEDPLPLSVSSAVPLVKPDSGSKRVLLLASETVLESKARAALDNQQRTRESSLLLELVYLDLTSILDFLAVLDLLNHIQHGFFDVIHIIQLSLRGRAPAILVTPVNVLSGRVRHRLVSRRSRRLRIRKFVLPTRYLVWCAEQALRCPTKAVGLTIIFPEDLGGSQDGPSSIWTPREFQLLEGIRDARRAAGYLRQITGADYKRPLGVFSTALHLRSRLSLGWPCLEKLHSNLVYKGSLPVSCHCGRCDSL